MVVTFNNHVGGTAPAEEEPAEVAPGPATNEGQPTE
jgi:hypothetical protein